VEEGADNLVSPVLVDAVAVVPEWWVFVALFAAAALFVVLAFMILDFNLKNLKKETFSTFTSCLDSYSLGTGTSLDLLV